MEYTLYNILTNKFNNYHYLAQFICIQHKSIFPAINNNKYGNSTRSHFLLYTDLPFIFQSCFDGLHFTITDGKKKKVPPPFESVLLPLIRRALGSKWGRKSGLI